MSQTIDPDPEWARSFSAAVSRYRGGDYGAAATLFTAVLEHRPDDADGLRLRGLSLVRDGRAEEGLPDLRRARALAPKEFLTHLHYGIGLMEAGRPARAAALFRRAAVLSPQNPAPWINLCAALITLGQAKAARAAARRAVSLSPKTDADAVYALGQAELANGDLAPAQTAFAEAIRRRRDFAAAWNSLVLVLFRAGEATVAAKALQRARDACPADDALAAAAAALDVLAGDQDRALAQLRAILARDPGCVAARLNLANAVLIDGEAQKALSLLSGPAPDGRDGAHWRAHRALALLKLGRDDEAAQDLDAIPQPYGDAEILILWRRINLALRAQDMDKAKALADQMARLADGQDSAPGNAQGEALYEHRIIGHFEIARFRQSIGDKAQAFRHWSSGHALLSKRQPFRRDEYEAFFERTTVRYGHAALHQGPVSAITDNSPIFIVGMPRSGTSLTEQILAAHPAVQGGGECTALHRLITRVGGKPASAACVDATADLTREGLTLHSGAYLAELKQGQGGARFVTDKMPANALHLGLIYRLFPKARVIICERDPRDVGLSIFQLRFFGYHPYAHNLSDLGWYMAQHARLMDHWRATLPARPLTLALADWVDNFAGTLARLLTFLDLPPDPACLTFHDNQRRIRTASAQQVRQPINRRGLGRWRAFEAELEPMIAALDPPLGFEDVSKSP